MKKETGYCEILGKKCYYEKSIHKTPRGGDYSVMYYLDDNLQGCDKSEATRFKIIEMTADGRILNTIISARKSD